MRLQEGSSRRHLAFVGTFRYATWSETVPLTPEPFLMLHRERVHVPPSFVGRTTASTLFSSLQSSLPGLIFETLAKLPVKLLVWTLGGDQDGGLHRA